jgi:hypothetical protein
MLCRQAVERRFSQRNPFWNGFGRKITKSVLERIWAKSYQIRSGTDLGEKLPNPFWNGFGRIVKKSVLERIWGNQIRSGTNLCEKLPNPFWNGFGPTKLQSNTSAVPHRRNSQTKQSVHETRATGNLRGDFGPTKLQSNTSAVPHRRDEAKYAQDSSHMFIVFFCYTISL